TKPLRWLARTPGCLGRPATMRVARSYAVNAGGPAAKSAGRAVGNRGYFAPERPRVADPERRRQIADYLSGGTTIGRGHGPDVLPPAGLWLWPERSVGEILAAGLAPEPDFIGQMQARGFRAPAPQSDARLTRDALAAWRGGPPAAPRLLITYFI